MSSSLKQLKDWASLNRGLVNNLCNSIALLNAVVTLGFLLYGYGWNLNEQQTLSVFKWLDFNLIVFAIVFFFRGISRPPGFFKENWFESIMIAAGVLNIILSGFHQFELQFTLLELIGVAHPEGVYLLLLSLFMTGLLLVEITRLNNLIARLDIKPATSLILSFIVLVFLGAGLLSLPAMSIQAEGVKFIDALFTSASASCVTGLTTVDTATVWTFRGQVVILFLIQIGGLGIITFVTFFTTYSKDAFGIKHQSMMQNYLNSQTLSEALVLLRRIVFFTLFIEFVGATILYFSWPAEIRFSGNGQRIFYSVFHSVSAFCNAGFSLFSEGYALEAIGHARVFLITSMLLIILGGLGFGVLMDVLSIQALKLRWRQKWRTWELGSRIAIYTSGLLLTLGFVGILWLEFYGSLTRLDWYDQVIHAMFMSASTRTAGFNLMDISLLQSPTLFLIIILMFIGGSPGGTSGGIKTTTFWLIVMSAIADITGKKQVEIAKRTIPTELLYKTYSVLAFAIGYNILALFFLVVVETDKPFHFLLFEQVSAFGTAGLSCNVTPELSYWGKVIIMLTMFMGRVGLVTFALAFSKRVVSNRYKYPEGNVLVG